ncbi:MAG: patatin-like phospholipase family protein [Planctomycetota bacterium]|nr:MAG: patatin-like phospholipase family protein [Planctomycetota bacterium]
MRLTRINALVVLAAVIVPAVNGCSLHRNPVPLSRITDAEIPGMPHIRAWDIGYQPSFTPQNLHCSDCSFLAISGGGVNGTFGAGFLCGWTEAGNRPKFKLVTGISTGALIAPFVFIGPEYDQTLKLLSTAVATKDVLSVQGILGLFPWPWAESFAEAAPSERLIEQYVDEHLLKAIAAEHAAGRRLYIGTTNLDAERFVAWDMGAIAASGHPDALNIFRKVMLASGSIPGAFPPVYFDVEIDGKTYDEMHVDGGAMTQVFGYGSLPVSDELMAQMLTSENAYTLYAIANGKLATRPRQVPRNTLKIIRRSFSTLMKTHSWGDLYRLYSVAERDNVDFNYVSIPDDYLVAGEQNLGPDELNRLFNVGFEMGKAGQWQKGPPELSVINHH